MTLNHSTLLASIAAEIGHDLKREHVQPLKSSYRPDADQTRVLESHAHMLRVLAPAGSGKTATLVAKAISIASGDPRARVLMLTFTNAGVNSFNETVRRDYPSFAERCSASTLNSFGNDVVNVNRERIIDRPDWRMRNQLVEFMRGQDVAPLADPNRPNATGFWEVCELTKQFGLHPEDASQDGGTLQFLAALKLDGVLLRRVLSSGILVKANIDGLQRQWLPLWRKVLPMLRPYGISLEDQKFRAYWDQRNSPLLEGRIAAKAVTHLLVDEFQDTNLLELYLVTSFVRIWNANLYIVGDDDQCIYEWKGCTPFFIRDPNRLIPALMGSQDQFETVILERNYRCPKNIVQHASQLIAHNRERVDKTITAVQTADANVRVVTLPMSGVASVAIAQLVTSVGRSEPNHEFALLARKKVQLLPLQVLLTKARVDFFIPKDFNLFAQESFETLVNALALRSPSVGMRPPQQLRDTLVALVDRHWKNPLRKAERDRLSTRLAKERTLDGMVDAIAASEAKSMDDGGMRAAAAIKMFLGIGPAVLALRYLFDNFTGFQQDYAKSREDIFLADPPFGLLIDLAATYDDEEEFLTDLITTRERAETMSGPEARKRSKVHLLTAYRAKGLQFDTVIVLDSNNKFWPAAKAVEEGRIEEERRLFYVAATRAKANLLFFVSDFIQGLPHEESPFINEMGLPASARLKPALPHDVLRELMALYPSRLR